MSDDDSSMGDSSGTNSDNNIASEGSPDGTGINESQNNNSAATTRANGAVAKIGSNEYDTLDNAVETAQEGSTIELLQDCTLTKGFNKTLTFTGAGKKITINNQLTSNGEGWMCFGLYDSSRVLTFDGVQVEWNSEVGTKPWLMLSLSGTMNVTNGANVAFTVDSGSTGARNAIYMNAGSVINVTGGSTFTIKGNETSGKVGQGIQLDKTGQAKINVKDNSTFLIDGTNRGYVNSPSIYVENSTFTVQNCTANASNGGNFHAVNSTVCYQNNAGHGLSADDVIIENTQFDAKNNGYYGMKSAGKFLIDSTSVVNATGNSNGGDFAALKLTSGVKDGQVEKGAVVNITDNFCSGLSNNGKVTFEEGAKLTITGNTNDKGSSSHGAGIYNSGSSAKLTLPSDAVIYNNHAKTDGDDIYNTGTITFGQTGSDWRLDGDNKGITTSNDCTDAIDGWYDDTANARWSAHADDYSGVHVESYALDGSTKTVTAPLALKAAHGLGAVVVDPADITIYMGGDDGYQSVVSGSGQVTESNSLPEPGFYFTLPDEVNEALQAEGITTEGEAADLSKYMKIYTHDYDVEGMPTKLDWKVEKYGVSYSGAYDKFIYRIVPVTDGGAPARLVFTSKDGSQAFTSDDFDPADIGALDQQYNMQLYTELVNKNEVVFEIDIPSADGLTSEKYYNTMELETGTLTIRYVTGNQDDVVTDVVASEDKLAEAKAENPDKAFALASDDMKYFINGSKIDVSDTAAPSLLFDDVVSDHNTNGAGAYDQQLANRALDVISSDGTELTNPWYQAKYLDLVDANNGNVWLTPENPVTIYWPYPEGTDENTEFHLVHFKGLDREISNDQITNEIDSSQVESVDIENTEHGIRFETDSFSPFVLTWDAGTEAGEQPEPTTNINESDANNVLPQTGDTTNWILPLVIACIAALVAVGAYRMSRRNR